METRLLPWKLVEASTDVHGFFHCRWKWKFPLLPSIAASTNIFHGGFHEIPYTPTDFHLLHRVSQTSSCVHKTNGSLLLPPPSPSLQRPPWYSMVCSAYSSSLPVSPTHEQVDCSENHLGSTCPPPLLQWSTARLRSKNRGGGVRGSLGGSKRYSKESVIH